jgi:hypothetical protein
MTDWRAELEPKVDKGVALLNEKRPRWFLEIDEVTLDMSSCEDCVLGQLKGHYIDGLREVFGAVDVGCGEEYGFSIDTITPFLGERNLGDGVYAWKTLRLLWIEKIEQLIRAHREKPS